jgi:crotonobetainyl-CoA:carnitine CoA-transferase CaiB-like acyl-CoA transferase
VGNDSQFAKFCAAAGHPDLAADPDFTTNRARVLNRERLIPRLREITATRTAADWMAALEAVGVPCGPVNTVAEAFADPQVLHRGGRITMPHPVAAGGTVDLTGSPIKMHGTPVTYRRPPPMVGEHTAEVLREAGFTEAEIAALGG